MPIFTYICNECGEKFDLLVGVTVQKEELKRKKIVPRLCGKYSNYHWTRGG